MPTVTAPGGCPAPRWSLLPTAVRLLGLTSAEVDLAPARPTCWTHATWSTGSTPWSCRPCCVGPARRSRGCQVHLRGRQPQQPHRRREQGPPWCRTATRSRDGRHAPPGCRPRRSGCWSAPAAGRSSLLFSRRPECLEPDPVGNHGRVVTDLDDRDITGPYKICLLYTSDAAD